MDGSAIFCSRTWILTSAGNAAHGETDLRAFKFCPAFCRFRTVPAHDMAFATYRYAVMVDGKIIFIDRRPSSVSIQVNKRNDAMIAAVFVVRHCIMGGIQQELCNNGFRQKRFHGKPVIKETDGIMPGSRAEERKDREVIFRIGGSKHV